MKLRKTPFFDHRVGEGLRTLEMTGFVVSCVHRCAALRLTFPFIPT